MALEFVCGLGDVERCADVAHAPACHGVAFGHAVGDYGAVLHSFHLRHGVVLLSVGNHVVDFVAEDEDLRVFAKDCGEGFKLLLGVHAARGVGGGAEDEKPCVWRDGCFELFGAHLEVLLDASWDDDALALGEYDLLGVRDPVGGGEDDLVTLVDYGEDDVDEAVLAASGHDDLVDIVIEAEPGFHSGDDSFAEVGIARDGWVVRLVVLDSLDSCRFDVFWCVEVRLADREVDDVESLSLKLSAFLGHCECRGL